MALAGIVGRFLQYISHLKNHGISMSAMAKASGISNGLLGKWVSGHARPSMESLEKFLRAYPAINSDWLLLGQGKMLNTSESTVGEPDIKYGSDGLNELHRLRIENAKLKQENDTFREALAIIGGRPVQERKEDEPLHDGA